jgi:prepilin-type N-terminal cleavage/methylation domain-containing protein
MKHTRTQKGFTIVELMIATSIFSAVMLICAAAITYIGRVYYKGVITNRTQDAARRVMQEISSTAQFIGLGSPVIKVPPADMSGLSTGAYCLGTTRYTYVTNRPLGTGSNKSQHVLWQDAINVSEGCIPLNMNNAIPTDSSNNPQSDGRELLETNMRMPVLEIQPGSGGLVNIDMAVSYGDTDDLFRSTTPAFTECAGLYSGGQFCASSILKTSVTKRL